MWRRPLAVAVCVALLGGSCSSDAEVPTAEEVTTGHSAPSFVRRVTLLEATDEGIEIEFPDGSRRLLTIDVPPELADPFGGIRAVASDLEGGIVFQPRLTPPPWTQGTIFRLPAGASQPEVVYEPPAVSNV